jgi:hypothetical protein
MNPESKRKTVVGVIAGLGLEIVSRLLAIGGDRFFFLALVMFGVATLLFIWGCTHYAMSKGLPHWLGYLGLFSVVGLVVILFLPARRSVPYE